MREVFQFYSVRLLIFLCLGIWASAHLYLNLKVMGFILMACISLTLIFKLFAKRFLTSVYLFDAFIAISAFSMGFIAYTIHQENFYKNHFTHSLNQENKNIEGSIAYELKPSSKYFKYVANIYKLNQQKSEGKAIVYVKKEDSLLLNIGQKFICNATLYPLQHVINPNQFDYSSYLKNHQIYGNIYANSSYFKILKEEENTIENYSNKYKIALYKKLEKSKLTDTSKAILKAMLLGDRYDINEHTYKNFIASGIVHILAISGLHIGIIMLIIHFFLSPLLYLPKGKIMRSIITILLLWSFAIIAGFQPSVVRACTMFSIIALANGIQRKTHIVNVIAISALILLLINPNYLFDIGFQLSYAALLGIVIIEPLARNFHFPKNIILQKIYTYCVVILAAQIGVFPLSLHYFNQFPSLFIIGNLLVTPLVGVILILGILIITFASFNIHFTFLEELTNTIINYITWVAESISHQKNFLFTHLYYDKFSVFITYLAMFCFIIYLKKRKISLLMIAITCVIMIQTHHIITINTRNKTEELTLFYYFNSPIFARQYQNTLTIFTDTPIDSLGFASTFITAKQTNIIQEKNRNTYVFKEKKILVIDTILAYNKLKTKPEFIVLFNNPKVNLTRILNTYKPECVIIHPNNYANNTKQWLATCTQEKIPVYNMRTQGPYIWK